MLQCYDNYRKMTNDNVMYYKVPRQCYSNIKPQCKLVLYVLGKATGIAKFLLS